MGRIEACPEPGEGALPQWMSRRSRVFDTTLRVYSVRTVRGLQWSKIFTDLTIDRSD